MGFQPELIKTKRANKPTFTVSKLSDKLILRHCARILRVISKTSIKPRNQIIREIKGHLAEGGSYRIYKLDIASFFESCPRETVLSRVSELPIGTHARLLINSFISSFNNTHSGGLPRGVEISPILSEIYLKKFDALITEDPEVFYFARFVDDIFIITSGFEDVNKFIQKVIRFLPDGLSFNDCKKVVIDVPRRTIGDPHIPQILGNVDYLGYKLTIVDQDLSKYSKKTLTKNSPIKFLHYRQIEVDLSDRKVKKLSERVIKSFYSFSRSGDYELLRDRIIFLTSNRDMVNKRTKRKIPTGIYYSYSQINTPSQALASLDKLIKSLILHPKGRIGSVLAGKLTRNQKKELLKISLSHGHEKRVFKRFPPNRLNAISRIWK